jgi:hypothetical protein
MAIPRIRWFRWIAIAIAVLAALALLWAIWWLWSLLSPQWDTRTIIASVIVALVALAAIWWLWWRLPRRQVARLSIQIPDPKARADAEDNFRKTVGQALGGAAVLIGAGAAYLQFTQQQQGVHDLLISNQASKGFEQLASEKITMRLGGIYALEGVMNTSLDYHQSVLEALCAFVRDGTKGGGKKPATDIKDKPPTDIQTAITVIGRRKPGPGDVNLARANIPGVLLELADLSGATLTGADLSGADLSGATLTGADLSGADLSSAILIFAHLPGARLTGAHLPGADLSRADLTAANLTGADLTGADLTAADLFSADLTAARLSKAKNLTQDKLDQACGSEATLPEGLTLKLCQPGSNWLPFPSKPVAPTLKAQ